MEPVLDEDGVPRLAPTPGFDEYRDVIEEAIKYVAEDREFEVRDYSGRYMYKAKCLGVVVDVDPAEFVQQAAGAAVVNSGLEAGRLLAEGAETDSIGSENIVYWPDLIVP